MHQEIPSLSDAVLSATMTWTWQQYNCRDGGLDITNSIIKGTTQLGSDDTFDTVQRYGATIRSIPRTG